MQLGWLYTSFLVVKNQLLYEKRQKGLKGQ